MIDMRNPHYAGFWVRVLAAVFDGILGSVLAGVIFYLFLLFTGQNSLGFFLSLAAGDTTFASIQWTINILLILAVIYMDGTLGGTPGKLLLGLRIVNEKGNYIGIPMAVLRYIGKFVSAIILGIGFLMIAFNNKKQGLHDKIASTYVVHS